jgi:hypothetical protein
MTAVFMLAVGACCRFEACWLSARRGSGSGWGRAVRAAVRVLALARAGGDRLRLQVDGRGGVSVSQRGQVCRGHAACDMRHVTCRTSRPILRG